MYGVREHQQIKFSPIRKNLNLKGTMFDVRCTLVQETIILSYI